MVCNYIMKQYRPIRSQMVCLDLFKVELNQVLVHPNWMGDAELQIEWACCQLKSNHSGKRRGSDTYG